MTVSLIAAVARNGVIGNAGRLPWRLPADLARFKRLTTGHHVIMGRRTYESIGKALPDRVNLVLSRQPTLRVGDGRVLPTLTEALDLARAAGDDEAFVIGGAEVYAAALPIADRIYLTKVDADVPGDVSFPKLDPAAWHEEWSEAHASDHRHAHDYAFSVLGRIS